MRLDEATSAGDALTIVRQRLEVLEQALWPGTGKEWIIYNRRGGFDAVWAQINAIKEAIERAEEQWRDDRGAAKSAEEGVTP